MKRLKILLLLFIILLAYSVTCEDLQQVKRPGWLRARQIYQFNHPPIVENDDTIIPVVYDKVIERGDRLQKISRENSFANSEERKSAETVSIFKDNDFEIDATTTEVFDAGSTTEYVDNSEYITEIPEEFLPTPKYKKRKWAKNNYSFQSKSNPVSVTSNDEQSYTVRNIEQRKYGDHSESDIDHTESNDSFKKSTEVESETYDANGMSITGIKRRPGMRRLRKNKKTYNFGHQGLSQISGMEQTETDGKNNKQVLLTNTKATKSEETKYDEASGSTINDNADVKHSLLSTDSETKDIETKKSAIFDNQQTVHLSNVQTFNKDIESVTKNNYETNSESTKKGNFNTLKYVRRPQTIAFRHYKTSEASLAEKNAQSESTDIKTDNIAKNKSDQPSNEQFSSNGAEQLTDTENKNELASQTRLSNNTSEKSLLSSNTVSTSIQSHTVEMKNAKNLDTIQLSNTQVSESNFKSAESNYESESGSTVRSKISSLKYLKRPQIFATRRNYTSGTSLSETESTQSKTNEFVNSDKLKTVQIPKVMESSSNTKSATGDNYESDSGSTIKNQLNTLKYLKRPQIYTPRRYYASGSRISPLTNNTDTENKQIKTDEDAVAAGLNTVQKSTPELSNNTSQSVIGNHYKSNSGSIVKNKAGTLHLRRPQKISTQRNYASGASFESTNRETESALYKTDEDIVTGIEISNVQASNRKVESATDSNYENTSESSGKNRVSTLKYLKRPLTFATRRSNNSTTSLLSKNVVAESTQSKSAESMDANKLNTAQGTNIQSINENVTGSNYRDISETSVKNNANSIKYLIKRPPTFASRRNYTSVTSDKSTKLDREFIQNQTDETVVEDKFNTVQISSMQASNLTADSNNESISGLLLKKQVSTIKKFKRPHTFSTRRNYASAPSLSATNTESFQNKTEEVAVVNKPITVGILNKNAKLTTDRRPQKFAARRNFAPEVSRISQNTDTESTQTETTNNDFFPSQYQNSDISVTSANMDLEQATITTNKKQSATTSIDEASNIEHTQHEIEKVVTSGRIANTQKSLFKNVDTTLNSRTGYNETAGIIITGEDRVENEYNKDLQLAVKSEETIKQQNFATTQNENSAVTVTSSQLDTPPIKTQAQTENSAFTNSDTIVSKTLYDNLGKSEQDATIESFTDKSTVVASVANTGINTEITQNELSSAISNKQMKITKTSFTDAKIVDTEESQIETKDLVLKDEEAKTSFENIYESLGTVNAQTTTDNFAEKQAKLQTLTLSKTERVTKMGHELIQNDSLAEDLSNVEKPLQSANKENSPHKKESVLETTESVTDVKSRSQDGSRARSRIYFRKPKVSATGRYSDSAVSSMGVTTQSDNNNLKISSQRDEKSSLAKSIKEQESFLEQPKSTVISSARLRGQKSHHNSKFRNNIDSKNYNIENATKPVNRFFDKSLNMSFGVTLDETLQKNNSENKTQKNVGVFQIAKKLSADALPETIDASKVFLEDTVVENNKSQSKLDTKQTTKTWFTTAAKFKINDGISEDTSELKHEIDFTKPEQDSTKILTITADSANTNLPAISPGQQHQVNHQQYFESDSSIYNSRTTFKPSKTEDNVEKEIFTSARIKSNEHNQADVRITTNRRKLVETSNTKAIKTNGMNKTVTNQLTRVTASSPSERPIELKKEIIETVANPFISRQQQNIETATRTISSITEKKDSQIEENHSRRIVAGSRTKPVATTKQIFTSFKEPTIKISERPIEVSTFTLTKTETGAYNPGTRRRNSFDSTTQYTYKPTLITKEVFVERPVQYSVEIPAQNTSHQVIQSRTKMSSSSWTSNGSHSQDTRLHGDQNPIVPIIEQENRVFSQNGAFIYSYEAGDGTRAFSKGKLKEVSKDHAGEAVEGGFSYKDKDGNDFSMSYTADENGYRPVGAHLPTPPPIPIAIARALAYLATKSTPEPVTEPTWKH